MMGHLPMNQISFLMRLIWYGLIDMLPHSMGLPRAGIGISISCPVNRLGNPPAVVGRGQSGNVMVAPGTLGRLFL